MRSALTQALRRYAGQVLRLPEHTDAFRVINSDGDGLSGLIVDKYGDVLSIEVRLALTFCARSLM
jgi:23S rRNA (cytosine1962-C5)-methyltransferase